MSFGILGQSWAQMGNGSESAQKGSRQEGFKGVTENMKRLQCLASFGGDDAQVLEQCLAEWSKAKVADALSAFPTGRGLVVEAKDKVKALRLRDSNSEELKVLWVRLECRPVSWRGV